MSNSNNSPAVSGTVLVVALVAAFCFVVAAAVAITVAVPDGGNAGSLITLLLGSFGALVPALVGLVKITGVARQVDDLANGAMDRKIRDGVSDVIKDEHLKPRAVEEAQQ